jgi:hypothetical protein
MTWVRTLPPRPAMLGVWALAVGACDALAADDVELADGDAVAVAERVEAGVLVKEAGQQPG